jgi:hypothetical protein
LTLSISAEDHLARRVEAESCHPIPVFCRFGYDGLLNSGGVLGAGIPVTGGLVMSVTASLLSARKRPQLPQKRALTGNSEPQNSQRCMLVPRF